MIEQKVFIKGLEINYKVFGKRIPFDTTQGKTLLVLHGWGSNSDRWQEVAETLAKRGFKIIIPDMPGFEKSQRPEFPWNLDNYVEWLYDFCGKIPELKERFYLLGHSFG